MPSVCKDATQDALPPMEPEAVTPQAPWDPWSLLTPAVLQQPRGAWPQWVAPCPLSTVLARMATPKARSRAGNP